MDCIHINGDTLTLEQIHQVAAEKRRVAIDVTARDRMQLSRDCIEKILLTGRTVYGVNTGFGKLSHVHIAADALEELQLNLVLSHACGTGELIPHHLVRSIMLLKANSLCKGYSGTRPVIAEFLIEMLNNNIIPCIPAKGSVGASGDLAPLAHMTLVMLGLGEAWWGGKQLSGDLALRQAGLLPISLKAKEGLSLLNGTQVMTSYAVNALHRALLLSKLADIAGAMTVESLLGTATAFDQRIQAARGNPFQIKVGQNMQRLMADSEIVLSHKDCEKIQDAYSSRCIPQVHGAVRQALSYCRNAIETEINACSDNPLVFYQDNEVLSGGNFHGQPISLACDTLSIAVSQLANISERRLENMMDTVQSGLPPFLTEDSGINSGYMIAQVSAAALVSENKVLSHPASVDSIPTSANQEDFVSMGTHAARKAVEIVDNAETIIGIELLAGCQAIDFRKNLLPGQGTRVAHQCVRRSIPTLHRDRLLHQDIKKMKELIGSNIIVHTVEKVTGSLES